MHFDRSTNQIMRLLVQATKKTEETEHMECSYLC